MTAPEDIPKGGVGLIVLPPPPPPPETGYGPGLAVVAVLVFILFCFCSVSYTVGLKDGYREADADCVEVGADLLEGK